MVLSACSRASSRTSVTVCVRVHVFAYVYAFPTALSSLKHYLSLHFFIYIHVTTSLGCLYRSDIYLTTHVTP